MPTKFEQYYNHRMFPEPIQLKLNKSKGNLYIRTHGLLNQYSRTLWITENIINTFIAHKIYVTTQ